MTNAKCELDQWETLEPTRYDEQPEQVSIGEGTA